MPEHVQTRKLMDFAQIEALYSGRMKRDFARNEYNGFISITCSADKVEMEKRAQTDAAADAPASAAPAEDVRKEAKRRRKLYDEDADFKGSKGNYLRIIGYDKDKEFDSRYCYVPGKLVTTVHGTSLSWLEIFVHAP